MSLLRFVARSMLASYFVANGVRAFTHPEEFVAAAEPLAEKVVPLVNSALPQAARELLPTDTADLVKLSGALQVAGGLSLATGLGRRLGAGMLAATMVPHVLASNPLKTKGSARVAARAQLGKNVALLGGVMLAAQDTEGRPGLVWKVRMQKQLLSKDASRRKAELQRDARATAAVATRLARRSVRGARRHVEGVLS